MMARLFALLLILYSPRVLAEQPTPAGGAIRFATYNVSFYRNRPGALAGDLATGNNPEAQSIAEVIQRVRPQVLLLCEFDYDVAQISLDRFHELYLKRSQNGQAPCDYPHRFIAPVNTGLATGFDLDKDGQLGGPGDAVGFGRYEGQYGMAVLSVYPLERSRIRTFQRLLWKDMPGALLPQQVGSSASYYTLAQLKVLRLSSKSHWDVPVLVPGSDKRGPIHFLCSHPTPPVFDGTEDRHGRRNHDEIRLWADYISSTGNDYLVDDMDQRGGLQAEAAFVIAGDLNADPLDGESVPGAIQQLLNHRRVVGAPVPVSDGGRIAASKQPVPQRGDAAHHTADFSQDGVPNLRCDYVLPSRELRIAASGVFWPAPGQPGDEAITATDHRLVWVDVVWADSPQAE
jgi:hypothetical protein